MPRSTLEKSVLFQILSRDLLDLISELCCKDIHLPGAELFSAGQTARHLYVLDRGNVALLIRSEAREEVILSTITKSGDLFAWSALVEPHVLTSSAECLTETTVLRLEGQRLNDILDEHPEEGMIFMRRLASLIATRLKDTQRRLIGSIS